MNKISKFLSTASVLGVAVVAASCSKKASKTDLQMWTGFGKDYTGQIEEVLAKYNEDMNGTITVTHTSKGSYNGLETDISNSIDGRTFPHIANGYPDHFAEYCHKGVMKPLNTLIKNYNAEHGGDLMADFFEQYTVENETIRYDKVTRQGYIMGLPFNKSTEIMVANGFLIDYVQTMNPSITAMPKTWQELDVIGPKIVDAMKVKLGTYAVTDPEAKYLVGKVNETTNKAYDFRISTEDKNTTLAGLATGEKILQDVTSITEAGFRVLGYDSAENAFITMLHQWGSEYTEFSADLYFNNNEYGKAHFWDADNKAKTKAGLEFIKGLYDKKCFGLPGDWNLTNFCTDAFEAGNCLFSIGSSGGLSNSTDANKRIEVLPILYYSDGVTTNKYVISQGTSLGLFTQYPTGSTKEEIDEIQKAAFETMVALCTGDRQAAWVTKTGYFPSSRSAMNSAAYQDLLNDRNPSPLRAMYQKAGNVNVTVYDAENWHKFVDPGFLGSSKIRSQVGYIISNITSGGKDIDTYMNDLWDRSIDPQVK